jgi:beta-mannosidase
MMIQKLHAGWTMTNQTSGESMPAIVPGSVYNDLLVNGKMEDPFWRDNEDDALKRMDDDYEYTTSFDVDPELLSSDQVVLRCEGLDTIADVTLNGVKIGYVNNMHRIWEFDVTSLVKETGNKLTILFYSPTRYIKKMHELTGTEGSSDAMVGFPDIRKAHCMFGWDWGIRLPDAGIWRDIMLCGITTARIDSVYVTQHHENGLVELSFDVDLKTVGAYEKDYRVTITDPDGNQTTYENSPETVAVKNPQLWWPNGYGKQPLYTICVDLMQDGKVLDTWERRIGLRTMTMHREKDQYGESFAHEVNGVQIFAMGADYIPEDNIYSRITPERTRELLNQCVAANYNAIRVWGGGYYPDDFFYDICDELGLMVWQDFMFACATYDLSDEFEENIVEEFKDNIKRIRHHASLGLWCGNNEMEMFVKQREWVTKDRQVADYIKMYEYLIPKALKKYDPNTFYWPASPSSGGSFDDPNDENRGDVHYWDVWHGNKPFSEYRKFYFRYASEFGFESFPAMKTIETFTLPEDRNAFSYVMEKHQRCNSANGKIMNYLYQTFLYPTSFEMLVYASQLLQAEAIKYGVEHFRRNRGRCMGAIYWQLNDCWPVASWASVDYCGRWKALHYYAKRFFSRLMLSCCEEGLLTQDANVNAEPYEVKKSIQLNVANEMMSDQTVTVCWSLRNQYSDILQEGTQEVTVPALTSIWLDKIEFPNASLRDDYVSYQMLQDGKVISSGSVIFGLPKHYRYADPKLTCRVEGDEIVVTAQAYAKGVEIQNEDEDLLLSDNYFDMDKGEVRVKVLSGNVDTLRLRSVYDIR